MEMHRLPCGIIYSGDFARFLAAKHADERGAHGGELLAIDYVRCKSGDKAGDAWWQIGWVQAMKVAATSCFRIGSTEVFIHRQAMRGLRNRLLHCANGQVVVRS